MLSDYIQTGPDAVQLTLPIPQQWQVIAALFIVVLIGFYVIATWNTWAVDNGDTDTSSPFETLVRLIRSSKIPSPIIALTLLLWGGLFLTLTYGMLFSIFDLFDTSLIEGDETNPNELRARIIVLAALTATMGGLIALPFTILRTRYNAEQTEVAKQSHITDQINKAVENLGATRILKNADGIETTEPNLEVRIGGILALEQVSSQNPNEHIRIMRILCSYIRERTSHDKDVVSVRDLDKLLAHSPDSTGPDLFGKAHSLPAKKVYFRGKELCQTFRTPPPDVMEAVQVIGQRTKENKLLERAAVEFGPEGYKLDLRGVVLRNTVLRGCDFKLALLSNSSFQGTTFVECDLRSCLLEKAKLDFASIRRSNLTRAILRFSFLRYAQLDISTSVRSANFLKCRLNGANCYGCDFNGSFFMKAILRGARFRKSDMRGVDFEKALFDERSDFSEAQLENSVFRKTDISMTNITYSQASSALGDNSVSIEFKELPEGWIQGVPSDEEIAKVWKTRKANRGYIRPDVE